jgi:hypothetical protein
MVSRTEADRPSMDRIGRGRLGLVLVAMEQDLNGQIVRLRMSLRAC